MEFVPGWRNGRRSRLKPGGRKACGFESRPRHHGEPNADRDSEGWAPGVAARAGAQPPPSLRGRRVEHLSWDRRRALGRDSTNPGPGVGLLMTMRCVNFSRSGDSLFALVRGCRGYDLAKAVEHGVVAADVGAAVDALVFAGRADGTAGAAVCAAGHDVGFAAESHVAADAALRGFGAHVALHGRG